MIKINPIFNRIMVVNLISEYENHWAVSVMYKNIFNSNALSFQGKILIIICMVFFYVDPAIKAFASTPISSSL